MKIFEHIDAIVAAHWKMRDEFESYRGSMSPSVFAKEFETVGVSLPRRAGKSTYIRLRATPMDAIIVMNHAVKDHVMRGCDPAPGQRPRCP
jgi:hypothetical protein